MSNRIAVAIPFPLAFWVGALLLSPWLAMGQCPNILDGDGAISANPVYYECNDGGSAFEFWPLTDGEWTDVTVDWGDGTAPQFFSEWSTVQAIHHVYAYQEHATYVVTFSAATCSGTATLEKSVLVNPSITVPEGWPTGACAPATLSFVNGSTNVTPDTEFTWFFDDGTSVSAGAEDEGATTDHLYGAFTAGCQREVTLSATNACRTAEFGVPAANTIDYINIWDRDNPLISTTATTLCWPENTVDLRNVSEKICLNNGNTEQRKERWDFGGPYGPGGIGEIDWRPWMNSDPLTLTFNAVGFYEITLAVENSCGVDSTSITIEVRDPLAANLSGPAQACAGTVVYFDANSPEADWFEWNYGTNSNWYPSATGSPGTAFGSPGNYTVSVRLGLDDQGESCTTTSTHDIQIHPRPLASISLSQTEGCDAMTIEVEELHQAGESYQWMLPDGTPFSGPVVGEVVLDEVGTHPFSLSVTSDQGCTRQVTKSAIVHPSPIADFTATDVCEGSTSSFTDLSVALGSDTLMAWNWTFGDAGTSSVKHPEHVYASTGSFAVTLEVSDLHCAASTSQLVSVNESPDLAITSDVLEGCSPIDVAFNAVSNGTVTWDFGDGNGGAGPTVTHAFWSQTEAITEFVVMGRAQSANNCITERQMTVSTLPSAEASFSLSDPGCSPYNLVTTNESERANDFKWAFHDGSTSGEFEPTFAYQNVTEAPQSWPVELIALADNGCHDTTSATVTVFPEAVFELILDEATACSPFAFATPLVEGAENHQWDFGDGSQSTVPNPVHVYVNSGDAPVTHTVALQAENSYGCANSVSEEVTVKPTPNASFSANIQSGCAPLTVEFSDQSEHGQSFSWNYGDASTAEGLNGILHNHTFELTGPEMLQRVVTLTVTAEGGCTDAHTLAIEVYPEADFELNLSVTEGCAPFFVALPAMNGATQHNWNFGDGTDLSAVPNPTHTFENETNQPLTHTLSFEGANGYGCVGTTSQTIQVNPTPVASFTVDANSGCAPFEVLIEDQSQRAVAHEWNYDDGTTATGLGDMVHGHTYDLVGFEAASKTVTLFVEANGGCVDSQSLALDVYPRVEAIPTGTLTSCAPWEADLLAEGYTDAPNHEVLWVIDEGETVESSHFQRTFIGIEGEDQSIALRLQIESPFGCTDDTTVWANVFRSPVADFQLSESAACAGTPITYTDLSLYADVVSFDWGDGQGPSTDPGTVHAFEHAQFEPKVITLTQSVETEHNCTATAVVNHTVYPEVVAAFLEPAAGCAPMNLTLVNQSANANGTFTWDFGDGTPTSNNAQPSHVFTTAADVNSVYTIELHATSIYGCEDTHSHQVEVHATPVANVEVLEQVGCYPLEVTFSNQSIGGETFTWNYGTGPNSTESAIEHTIEYFNPSEEVVTYSAVLTASTAAGCSSQDVVYIDVLPAVEAHIDGGATGCSPLEVAFLNASVGASEFEWTFGDGGVSGVQSAEHTFLATPGEDTQYAVTMVAKSTYGCTDTAQVLVQVYAQPQANFQTASATLTYPETAMALDNNSLAGESASYFWTFGDGEVSYDEEPQAHTYNEWGTFDITLNVDNGYCSSMSSQSIQILAPSPTIGFSGSGSGCAPLTVEFENASTFAQSYRWEISDGSVRSDDNPVHVFHEPGLYDVTLVVIGYDSTELREVHAGVVEVFPTAQAAFTLNPNHVMVPGQPVFFVNLSEDATTYLWDFGDGNTSHLEAPVHEYTEAGTYDVALTTNNAWGCSTSLTLPQAVEARADGFMVFPTAFTPNASGPNGGQYDPTSYDNDVFRPMHAGVESYELLIFTKWGEMIFQSQDVWTGWDGYIQGQLAATDVYAWKATARLSNGETLQQLGNVTLLAK